METDKKDGTSILEDEQHIRELIKENDTKSYINVKDIPKSQHWIIEKLKGFSDIAEIKVNPEYLKELDKRAYNRAQKVIKD
ncbi:MAG: hypothetical protein GY941_27945 [Planctomycetes bacterium]|nr:hypothetical protein [Planctomycetota bacterium]